MPPLIVSWNFDAAFIKHLWKEWMTNNLFHEHHKCLIRLSFTFDEWVCSCWTNSCYWSGCFSIRSRLFRRVCRWASWQWYQLRISCQQAPLPCPHFVRLLVEFLHIFARTLVLHVQQSMDLFFEPLWGIRWADELRRLLVMRGIWYQSTKKKIRSRWMSQSVCFVIDIKENVYYRSPSSVSIAPHFLHLAIFFSNLFLLKPHNSVWPLDTATSLNTLTRHSYWSMTTVKLTASPAATASRDSINEMSVWT